MELIINPIGGLANRMRAIVSAVALCNDHDITLKEIVWAVNSELYCPYGYLFEPVNNIKVTDISKLKELFYYDRPRKQNLFLSSLFQLRSHNLYLETNFDLNSFQRNYKKSLLIRSGSIFYDFSPELYREIIKPKQDIIIEAKNRIPDNDTIGLHIRRTDNIISIKESPLELFIDAIDSELKNCEKTKFYLATDDESVKKQLVTMYGNDTIRFSPNKASRNSIKGIKEGLTEMVSLSFCKKIYGSYWSSFSEAAALLGNNELIQLKK